MRFRHNANKAPDITPGPSDYATNSDATKPSQPSFTIAARLPDRADTGDTNTPAPGDYHSTNTNTGPVFSFPAAAAITPEKSPEYVPGPGEYNIAATIGSEAPAFSMLGACTSVNGVAGRYGMGGSNGVPGPGEYKAPDARDGPAFTMGAKNYALEGPAAGEWRP
jgi:hypothetical protein